MKSGVCNPNVDPVILKETTATAWVDGCDALGATVGNFCMDLAVKKAKECGVGWVAAKRKIVYSFYFYLFIFFGRRGHKIVSVKRWLPVRSLLGETSYYLLILSFLRFVTKTRVRCRVPPFNTQCLEKLGGKLRTECHNTNTLPTQTHMRDTE